MKGPNNPGEAFHKKMWAALECCECNDCEDQRDLQREHSAKVLRLSGALDRIASGRLEMWQAIEVARAALHGPLVCKCGHRKEDHRYQEGDCFHECACSLFAVGPAHV